MLNIFLLIFELSGKEDFPNAYTEAGITRAVSHRTLPCPSNLKDEVKKEITNLSQLDVPLVHSHLIIGEGQSREEQEHDRFALSIDCHSKSTIRCIHSALG